MGGDTEWVGSHTEFSYFPPLLAFDSTHRVIFDRRREFFEQHHSRCSSPSTSLFRCPRVVRGWLEDIIVWPTTPLFDHCPVKRKTFPCFSQPAQQKNRSPVSGLIPVNEGIHHSSTKQLARQLIGEILRSSDLETANTCGEWLGPGSAPEVGRGPCHEPQEFCVTRSQDLSQRSSSLSKG